MGKKILNSIKNIFLFQILWDLFVPIKLLFGIGFKSYSK